MPLTRGAGEVHNHAVKTLIDLVRPGLVGLFGLVLASCDSFNQPLGSGYDPLSSPGSRQPDPTLDATGPQYGAGQWLETSMPNTAFYARTPRGNDQPSKVLPASTPLKVITTEGTYVKVELEDGSIGYVPTIMVGEKRSTTEVPLMPAAPDSLTGSGGYSGEVPDPEVPPISVEDASSVPMTDRIE